MRRKDDNINLVEKGIMAKNKIVSNKIKVISFHMRSDNVTKKKTDKNKKQKQGEMLTVAQRRTKRMSLTVQVINVCFRIFIKDNNFSAILERQ